MKSHHRRGVTFVDLIVVLVLLVFAGVVAVPQMASRARDTSNKVRCASNLKSLGMAFLLYANDNNGSYPRTSYEQNKTSPVPTQYTGWSARDPFGPGGPSKNDVTAPLFLLIRGDYTSPGVLVCPSDTSATPWNYNGGTNTSVSNFPDNKGLSYSVANPYAGMDALSDGFVWKNTLGTDFAVAADMNPGTPAVLTVTPTSSYKQMQPANSPNHQQMGQQVLFGDGHVDYYMTPFCGMSQDNIYTASSWTSAIATQPIGSTGIVSYPRWKGDSVLLPTYTGAARAHVAESQDISKLLLYAICGAVIVATIVVLIILGKRADKKLAAPG